MRDEFIEVLLELAEVDPSVTLLTGDLGFGVLDRFEARFPSQFINAGVAEQNMTGLACGLALEGRKVYTYSIGNFATLRCLEQIRNDVCYHDADVTVVSVGGGFSYGQLGMSHFATEDLAILGAIPNLRLVAPADKWETKLLVRQMAKLRGPQYLRLDKDAANSPVDNSSVILGEPRFVRHGDDVTIVSIGAILSEVLRAADKLTEIGILPEVISVNSLKPMIYEPILSSIRKTGRIICVEEHTQIGGLAAWLAQVCMRNQLSNVVFKAVGLEDKFPDVVGDQGFLRTRYGIDHSAIYNSVLSALK